MDTEKIRECIMANKVSYEKETNTITVSFGEVDIPIPLMFVREELYENVLKILSRLKWKDWYPVISTEFVNNSQETPISFYNLYKLMKKWRDNLISIKPLKGLGSMDSKDLTYTCMDPRNRKSLIIKGVGDVKRIIRLMEKDTAERKKIVSEYFT
jgi:DNA gyrase/topoisomerase IV subunit B